MTFSVTVQYGFAHYTHAVTPLDERRFRCTRRGSDEENGSAPPEVLVLTLGEEPQVAVWGKHLAALYQDLLQQIVEQWEEKKSG